jgi:hypothetical protein
LDPHQRNTARQRRRSLIRTAATTPSTGNGCAAAASAYVSLVKTLTTAGPFTAGQTISYTIVVANAGPSTATNVQVTAPTHLTIIKCQRRRLRGAALAIASVASGANATINVTATQLLDRPGRSARRSPDDECLRVDAPGAHSRHRGRHRYAAKRMMSNP